MTELLKDLEAVAGLDERATPGIIELHTSCSWRRIMAPRGRGFLVPGIDPDKHPNMDSIENAQFVVALVNWFRTHHAEIADMAKRVEVAERTLQRCKQTLDTTSECWRLDAERLEAAERDAARYRWLRDKSLGQWEDHPICVSQERSPLGMSYVAPLISGSLDAAIDAAMHNSAPEDGSHD